MAAGGALPRQRSPITGAHPCLHFLLHRFSLLAGPQLPLIPFPPPAQLLEFSPAPDGGVDVVWSAALNGTVRNATYTLEPAAPGVLNTSYELFSLPVEETYYILDYTEDGSYLLYFYCGSLLGSEYTGAVSARWRAAGHRPGPRESLPVAPLQPSCQCGPAAKQHRT